jgi:alpha-ribazole phosphatase
MDVTAFHAWRHPRPKDVAGRCIGHTDVAVDRRKAKRLAHRMRAAARREGWARVVWTSPLCRCADVGRWLARWGWRHRIDARLRELDFGDWDGRRWDAIGAAPVDAWCADFLHGAPGGGESVAQLLARCRELLHELPPQACIVAHAGWLNAARCVRDGVTPTRAAEWPPAPAYGARRSSPERV